MSKESNLSNFTSGFDREKFEGSHIFTAPFYDNVLFTVRFESRMGDVFDITHKMKDKIISIFVDQPEVGESVEEMYWSLWMTILSFV